MPFLYSCDSLFYLKYVFVFWVKNQTTNLLYFVPCLSLFFFNSFISDELDFS